MPIRNGCPGPIPPELAMSPAALTIKPRTAAPENSASAFCAAQPFTYPVGSNPPGIAQGSNQPPDSSRAAAQSSATSATSGGAWASEISPRRRRLTGLPGCQVLNTSSARCSTARARESLPRSTPNSSLLTSRAV